VDFAYMLHTDLGHRCRGARVDGVMVPLNTPLANGQTVEIVSARAGRGAEGPSRDWLNPQLGYVRSSRARTKVRQWFHAQEIARELATGRERVERVMQREGRTTLAFDELATRLRQPNPDAMFVAVAREEIGPRQLEEAVRHDPAAVPTGAAGAQAAAAAAAAEAEATLAAMAQRARPERKGGADDGVLVVGVDLLMTQLARCCRPVPPDAVVGFVTRGRGVSVHRANCATFARMAARSPERVLETAWGARRPERDARARGYPVDVQVRAADRPALLRDVTEVFARDRLNVIAVQTLSKQQVAHMQFTVEVPDAAALAKTLAAIGEVTGVFEARRK
jgi:GTP pyrophosphokinase